VHDTLFALVGRGGLEGDDISVVEFAATEYGRSARVIASDQMKATILEIGMNKGARENGFDRKNFVRKLVRGIPVKRNSYQEFTPWLRRLRSNSGSLPFATIRAWQISTALSNNYAKNVTALRRLSMPSRA
jgi:hypothetical protein